MQNCGKFADDIFKFIFFDENVWISLKISLKCVPRVQINNIAALVQIIAWHRPDDKPLSEPMMFSSLMHIYIIRPQWVKPILNLFTKNDTWISGHEDTCPGYQSIHFELIRCAFKFNIRLNKQAHDYVRRWNHSSHNWPFVHRTHPVTGEFPSQKASYASFDVFFDVSINRLLNKHLSFQWFEMPCRSYHIIVMPLSVWYKTKFGSQNFGYQLWCLFGNICNVFKNMFNVPLMIMW